MLPKMLPNARILTWSYNADVHAFRGDTSSDNIMQHSHTLVAQLQADREVGHADYISSMFVEPRVTSLSFSLRYLPAD